MTFSEYESNAITTVHRVDYDGIEQYQCIDLVRDCLDKVFSIRATGGPANAIAYWTNPPRSFIDHMQRLETSDAVAGDVLIFRTYGRTDLAGDGHIAMATGGLNASQVEVLEQHGAGGNPDGLGGNAIRTRWIDRSRVIGLYRPRAVVPATPVTPAPVVHPYWIEPFEHEIIFNKDAHRWNMTYDNFTAMANNPLETKPAGTRLNIVAKCHHNIGYVYYMDDISQPNGFNVADADLYTPPPPPSPAAISAPTVIPAHREYKVDREIDGYLTATMAINHDRSSNKVPAGDYLVFNEAYGMVNVTKNPNKPGSWINPADLEVAAEPDTPIEVPEAVTEPEQPVIADVKPLMPSFQSTYHALREDGRPVRYTALRDVIVSDVSGHRQNSGVIKRYADVLIYGKFQFEGRMYGRLKLQGDPELIDWFGAPVTDPESKQMNFIPTADVTTGTAARKTTETLRPRDYLVIATGTIEGFVKSHDKLIESAVSNFTKAVDIVKRNKIKTRK